jgi:uncharacterized membrane protein (DUF485 family)
MPTSTQDASPDWARLENDRRFRELIAAKRRFILPCTAFFLLYYFALPVLVGYYPDLMARDVVGQINIAYLFALSQFAMAWILMALYVKRAKRFDAMAAELVAAKRAGSR